MITLPTTEREGSRVDMVRTFGLLDQARPVQHDEVAALARDLTQSCSALVTLIDAERVFFSGAASFAGTEACRWTSFCTHVISSPEDTTWVADAREDFRFIQNAAVVGSPHIRFYAGAPIIVNGYAVGTVCVFDPEPRPFDPATASLLSRLARIVAEDLASRHREQSLRTALSASADALIDCDGDGLISGWSDGAEALFGFSAAEALGQDIDLIIPLEQRAAHHRGFEQWRLQGVARLGRRIDLRACCKDGSLVDIELWMSVAHVRGVPHIHANIRDISERVVQAAALKNAIVDAEAANEAKTTFLTNMSHELRTPLNGVVGVVDLLERSPLTDHQRELTSIIKGSSDQLGKLIGDILDLARIESGELVLSEAPMSIDEIVSSVVGISQLVGQEKGVSVSYEMAPGLPQHVAGDALRLKQVLGNLVSNAVKFTEAGSVCVRVDHHEKNFRFEVRDTGIGFDPAQREAIFARFQQADGTITRRFGGSGLGLSISRELVAAMGGELACDATPGRGATFWFVLPLPTVCDVASTESAVIEASAGPCRVLVVDDNVTNRRVAELILNTIGARVDCVEDGDQAVDAFLVERYDAILMDMMMPVMDGTTATRAIRDLERRNGLPRTPIIMLTANSLPVHVEASFEAGADLHLPKPVTPPALFAALAQVKQADTLPDRGVQAA